VRPGLDLPQERQAGSVCLRQDLHLEDVVGADANAVFLALAAIPVDDRNDLPGLAGALGCRAHAYALTAVVALTAVTTLMAVTTLTAVTTLMSNWG
jgi:hypothetical protein